ncbi:hypothetical protein AVO41_00960 [Thiomicrospira sp. WB1]|nr:hypothetical protein AVO41_00960 [Thiomicrospira sp. WB1]
MHLYRQGALTLIEVNNDFARLVMTTHGASVLSFAPRLDTGELQPDLLWVSERAHYSGEKPVRGGIPICWPWFGVSAEPGLPAHGFVRNMTWQLVSSDSDEQGRTRLTFRIHDTPQSRALWPWHFELSLEVLVGAELTLTLTSRNLDTKPFVITEAMHSYFSVSDANEVFVTGLGDSVCHDKLTDLPPYRAEDVLSIVPPLDRVYLNQPGQVQLHDPGKKRNIEIEKTGATATVVWNPGAELIGGFDDMDNQAWSKMLCVEAGNVLDQSIVVAPQASHAFRLHLRAKPLA